MKRLRSSVVATFPSSGAQKLGQPVPLSNFVAVSNNGAPQPAQTNVPARFSAFSGDVPARSVPCLRSTLELRRIEPLAPFLLGVRDRECLCDGVVTAKQPLHALPSMDCLVAYDTRSRM